MTAMDRKKRKQSGSKFGVAKGARRLAKSFRGLSTSARDLVRPTPSKTSNSALQLDKSTEKAIKLEVQNLLDGRGNSCKIFDMANALAASNGVRDAYGAAESTSKGKGFRAKIADAARRAMKLANESMERRYKLTDAFSEIGRRPGAIQNSVHTWEEAKEVLKEAFTFQEHNDVEEIQNSFNNSVSLFPNISSPIDQEPSSVKYRQIAATSAPAKVGKENDLLTKDIANRLAESEKSKQAKIEEVQRRLEEKEKEEEAKKLASSLLREFTEEEKDLIQEAIWGHGSPNEVLQTAGTDSVQRQSMRTLQPCQWLNDECIHFFYLMLGKRDEELCKADPKRKRSHFFKSFFMTTMLNEGHSDPSMDGKFEYKRVKRWSKKVPGKDIFELDKIFFPINQGGMHWVCAVAYMQEKRIQFYDSMGADGSHYLSHVFNYIKEEHQDKKKAPLPDMDDWKLVRCTRDTPRQGNGYDCGVFTCMFADFLSKDCPLMFTQHHVDQCRQRIALSIMSGQAIL